MASEQVLPPLPQQFKLIQHHMRTAQEHEKRDPVVAYFCKCEHGWGRLPPAPAAFSPTTSGPNSNHPPALVSPNLCVDADCHVWGRVDGEMGGGVQNARTRGAAEWLDLDREGVVGEGVAGQGWMVCLGGCLEENDHKCEDFI